MFLGKINDSDVEAENEFLVLNKLQTSELSNNARFVCVLSFLSML